MTRGEHRHATGRIASRRIELASVLNVRDLGGLRGAGGTFPRGVVLRSGSLVDATAGDAQLLCGALGVSTVVELRTAREIDRDGELSAPLAGLVGRVWAPPAAHEPFLDGVRVPDGADYLRAYERLAQASGPAVAAVLRAALAGDGAVLVACTAGKDRTGVVCCLLLALAGVRDAEIARDHALTARSLRPRLEAFRAHWERKGLTPAEYARRLETRPATMLELLCSIRARHGSVRRALARAGVSPELADRAPTLLRPTA